MPITDHRRLLRSMLLPINLNKEGECVDKLELLLTGILGDSTEEHFEWIESQLTEWHQSATPTNELSNIISQVLLEGAGDYGEIISTNYLLAHKELVENQLVSPEQARSFLSHLILITRLRDEEKMSSAQISKILDAMNPSAGFGRRSVEAILKKMKMAPVITTNDIEAILASDHVLSEREFGDSSLSECAQSITTLGTRLGYKTAIGADLLKLIDETDVSKFTPYLQILHYQCAILELFDHTPKDFYEFSPRGQAATTLFNRYPEPMQRAGNPFLNNAKSVGQINFPWAAAKKNNEFPGAAALFTILDGLDEMGYAARQELALWIRCFIHRFMAFAIPLETPIPENLEQAQYYRLLTNTAQKNTETRGIIEQRIVDAIGLVLHTANDNWVARGIGDPVNASNTSKKKLGDCDFQKIQEHIAIAYEAHGGILTQTYLDEHIRTLPNSIAPRVAEWSTFSNPELWSVKVIFIAHEFNAECPDEFEIGGVNICIEFMTYKEFFDSTGDDIDTSLFNAHVLGPLSQKRTPSFVRQKFIELIQP